MKHEEKKQMPRPSAAASDKKSDSIPHPGQPHVEGEGLEVPSHQDDLTGANGLSKHADQMLNPEHRAEDDQEFAKPGYENAASNPANHKKVGAGHKQGIEVVALRKGFYNQQRYDEGDRFTIRSFEEIGEWMKAVDPSQEKKRVDYFRQKKINARKAKDVGEE